MTSAVDDYIQAQPDDARAMLQQLRGVILAAAPRAEESIRYGIPSYTLDGRAMISLGAWKRHVGLYPVHVLDEALEREVAPLRTARSTVRLDLKKPFPRPLMERVIAAVVDRNARLVNERA